KTAINSRENLISPPANRENGELFRHHCYSITACGRRVNANANDLQKEIQFRFPQYARGQAPKFCAPTPASDKAS
ncbi:hypothetical protein LXJ59_25960, partial [Escherichia coli]|nr:hypothetical protein [Escherichia coli]